MSAILAIVPAYNEQQCIQQTIDELRRVCPGVDYLIVNDGSRDETAAICRRRHFNYINVPINCGLASGVQAGMKYAERNGYSAVVQFDADGQHKPEYILPMYEHMQKTGADVVIGSRFVDGTKPTGARGAGGKLISTLIMLCAHTKIYDPTSGMRMFNAKLISEYAHGFDLAPEPDALAYFARKGARIEEIPVTMRERQGGKSYFDLTHIISYMSRTCMSIVLFQWFR